jgi:galactose mutarotase-like enzyme
MPVHGFAASSRFTLTRLDEAGATARLTADEATRAHYPFDFIFEAIYRLTATELTVDLAVTNAGASAMPYACGLHPGFAWPFAGGGRAAHRIVFAEAEDPFTPEIAPGGLFAPTRRRAPLEDRVLALTEETFAREALCFLDARSDSLRFEGPGGAIVVTRAGFPHWALWSRPGAPFVCVEAWTGHGDPVGFAGELAEAPSMLSLPPGATARHGASFRFAPGD